MKTTNQLRKENLVGGFTLIELLTVIAVMAVIAAMAFPILAAAKRQQYLRTARGELDQMVSALENYKAKYGVYPPSNPYKYGGFNTLYYELMGVTNSGGIYTTLDGATTIGEVNYVSAFRTVAPVFRIDGVINCSKGGGEDGTVARNFLTGLRANRYGNAGQIYCLVTSVRGPDVNYRPLGVQDLNPFCYSYPGTNNANSFDLWVDLKIGNKTNRICNWKSAPFTL
jgi:prepilin-type N-terminal cleavage/methylation domain-containing protein